MDNITEPITQKRKSVGYYYLGALLVATAILLFVLIFTLELLYGRDRDTYELIVSVFAVVVFSAAFLVSRAMIRQRQHVRLEYITTSILRFVTSSVMLGYAYTKLSNGHMYASYAALDTRLTELNDFETVWSFYGRYSSLQVILGLAEMVPALLLLFRRTAFIGAVIMWPVVANVVLLNLYFEIGGLTFPVSLLILVFTTYILFSYGRDILGFLRKMSAAEIRPVPMKPAVRALVTALKFAPLCLLLVISLLRAVRPSRSAPLKGAYELSELKIDQRVVPPDSFPPDVYRKIYFEKRRIQSAVMNAEGFVRTVIDFLPGDSLRIAYRRGPLDGFVVPDTAGRFVGVYSLSPQGTLSLKGRQASHDVDAKYRKVILREFDYWWE